MSTKDITSFLCGTTIAICGLTTAVCSGKELIDKIRGRHDDNTKWWWSGCAVSSFAFGLIGLSLVLENNNKVKEVLCIHSL